MHIERTPGTNDTSIRPQRMEHSPQERRDEIGDAILDPEHLIEMQKPEVPLPQAIAHARIKSGADVSALKREVFQNITGLGRAIENAQNETNKQKARALLSSQTEQYKAYILYEAKEDLLPKLQSAQSFQPLLTSLENSRRALLQTLTELPFEQVQFFYYTKLLPIQTRIELMHEVINHPTHIRQWINEQSTLHQIRQAKQISQSRTSPLSADIRPSFAQSQKQQAIPTIDRVIQEKNHSIQVIETQITQLSFIRRFFTNEGDRLRLALKEAKEERARLVKQSAQHRIKEALPELLSALGPYHKPESSPASATEARTHLQNEKDALNALKIMRAELSRWPWADVKRKRELDFLIAQKHVRKNEAQIDFDHALRLQSIQADQELEQKKRAFFSDK